MASSARIDELKQKFDENPRRYFAPLANEFRKGGDLDQAILICEEFLPQQPGHMSGHIVYGQALFEKARLDDSRTVFETALALDPENLIALRHLGDIAGRQGDHGAARRWYERVLEADPRNDEIQQLIAALDDAPRSPSSPRESFVAPEPQAAEWREPAPVANEAQPIQAAAAPEPDLIDLDLTMPAEEPAVTDQPSNREPSFETPGSEAHEGASFDALSLSGIVPMPESAGEMPPVESRALGFESTEFAAPDAHVEQAAGLQSAFEDETGIYGASVAPLEGLDTAARHDDARSDDARNDELDGLPELLEDEGLVLPPHGDPVVATSNTPVSTAVHSDIDSLDAEFDVPAASPAAAYDAAPSTGDASSDFAAEAMDFDMPADVGARSPEPVSASADVPLELPPEVIAAEAELIDSGMSMAQPETESVPAGADYERESVGSELTFLETDQQHDTVHSSTYSAEDQADEVEAAPVAQRPFVTETMAELYLKQGFQEQALSVYQQLSDASPEDARLAEKVATLRAAAAAPAPADAGPTIRDFFARLAARRPGERGAAAVPPDENDFAEPEALSDAAPAAHFETGTDSSSPASPIPAPAGIVEQSGGTIDALFGNRPIGTSEDSAASALAQAFGASAAPSAPPITGNPARPATGELSLDSVFRDGASRGPRTSQGFSFDQFFSQNTEGDRTSGTARNSQEVPMPGEPAEKSADDIEQFNSWLQGLKNR